MKANELRIGNWVKIDEHPVEVVAFGLDGAIVQCLEINGLYQMHIEPIPLTEEWLVKFGFEKGDNITTNDNFYTIYDGYKLFISLNPKNGIAFVCDNYEENVKLKASILYVHQLQNLYFALTGEELTIKE